MSKLVFYINDNLQILDGSGVLRSELKPLDGKFLNLADRFEFIWMELHDDAKYDEYYILIGPTAGFTDTRIIYTWIKTVNMLDSADYFVSKVAVGAHIKQELVKAKELNNKILQYSKEPNIGVK